MNAPYYMADDDRDSLTQPEPPDCESCGVDADTPCTPLCDCEHCLKARARAKALEYLDVVPEQEIA